jgi:hypothetical protein
VLGENDEAGPSGSDLGGLLADLLEGARRRNLSENSLAAYERTWRRFSLGRPPQASIRELFLFLPRKRTGFYSSGGEERAKHQADPRRALLRLPALGPQRTRFRTAAPARQKGIGSAMGTMRSWLHRPRCHWFCFIRYPMLDVGIGIPRRLILRVSPAKLTLAALR